MAWLEDLARVVRIASLGKLARAAIAHEDWPEAESDNARSIENLLRLVDQKTRKGQVWLDHRPAVKEVLADLLGISPESLDPGSVEPDGPADPRIELKELRDARPLDLRREDLFPGIPRDVLCPEDWGLSWWIAQAGAGKTVVGRWLEARRRATFLRGDRWSEVRDRIPAEGAVYIELSLPDGGADVRFPKGLDGRNICVAAPFLPVPSELARGMHDRRESLFEGFPSTRRSPLTGPLFLAEPGEEPLAQPSTSWRRIDPVPKEEWVEALIEWVGARMKAGGGFDVGGALEVVRRRLFATSLVTPGDYIGVCGVIEKVGVQVLLADVEIERLVFAFLESRLERTDLAGRHTWTPRALWCLLQGCVEGAVVHAADHGSFPSELDLRSWLPDDSLPRGDDSGLRTILDEPGLTLEEIESIRSRARPTREGACRELFRLHLLEPYGGGALALRPSWIVPLARQRVLGRLIEEPTRGLGEVLLRPDMASILLPLLSAALSPPVAAETAPIGVSGNRWELVLGAIAGLRREDPASVAVLEACFQAVGMTLLDPGCTAPVEVLVRLWDAQMAVSVHASGKGPPRPRILRVEEGDPAWHHAWEIACLTISERLHLAGLDVGPPAVAPWGAGQLPEFAERLAWGLDHTCVRHAPVNSERREEPPKFVTDAWRLGGRLYRRFGLWGGAHDTSTLFAPFRLFDALEAGTAPVWRGWLSQEYQLDVLAGLAEDQGIGIDATLAALWRVRTEGESVFGADLLGKLGATWRARVWAALPPEVLSSSLRPWLEREERIAWDCLLPVHWEVVLGAWQDKDLRMRHGVAYIPEAFARRMLRERLFGNDTDRPLGTLWRRFPDLCVEDAVDELVDPAPWTAPAGSALWVAPAGQVDAIVERCRKRLDLVNPHEGVRKRVTYWAHQQCLRRGEHWRVAWELLAEMDAAT